MRKKNSVLFISLIIGILLSSCGNLIKDDMLKYNKNFKDLLSDIAEISKEIEAEQGKDDFKNTLKESVIPKLKEVQSKTEKLDPQTEEVKQLKLLFIDCIKLNLEGCNTVLEAIDTSNADTFQEAKDQFEQSQTLENEFRNKWDKLAEEQGIEKK